MRGREEGRRRTSDDSFLDSFPRRWTSDDSFLDSRVGGNRTIDRSIAMAGGLTRAAEALRMATTSGSGIEAGAASEAAAGAATTSAPRMIVDFAGQLTGFFTFTYEGVCWAIVAALFATNWLSRTWRRRLRKNLANAEMKHTLGLDSWAPLPRRRFLRAWRQLKDESQGDAAPAAAAPAAALA